MARMTLDNSLDEYLDRLNNLGNDMEKITEKVIMSGVDIVADEIRSRLERLPEDTFGYLNEGEKFNGVPKNQKKDLLASLGVTEMKADLDGYFNVKIGFDGYGNFKTNKYPQGVPNALLARSIESGSSVRKKRPFIRNAVSSTKKKAIDKMGKTIIEEMKIYAL